MVARLIRSSVRSTLRSTAPALRGTGRSSAAAHLLVVLTHLGVMAFVLLQLVELLPLDAQRGQNCSTPAPQLVSLSGHGANAWRAPLDSSSREHERLERGSIPRRVDGDGR